MSVAFELDPPLMPGAARRAVRRAAPEEADTVTSYVAAAQSGDEEAFRQLYRLVQPHLLRYLRTLVADDAEDVASETWLQVSRDLARFRGGFDDFRGWTITIARNRALDHLRKQQRRPREVMPIDELATAAHPDDTAAEATDSIATRRAVELIASLPREQAEAVMLRVVMGLEVATVSKILGKRPGAIRTATHRGLRRLAEQLGTDPGPFGGGPA